VFNLKDWFAGSYQDKKNEYLKNSFGFRDYLIRIHNQFEYSFFNKVNAKDVIAGKNNYLFEEHYIQGYYGTDYAGDDSINNIMYRLQFINDTLKKLNKTLILIIAPNKAAFYPEYIPDKYKTPIVKTNYDSFTKLLKKSSLNYIDFNSYFIANKQTSKYPLIPKNGTHWSMYGTALAGDSIVKYIEKARNITMPSAIWKNIRLDKGDGFDVDMENAMNLIFALPGPQMAYPDIKFEKNTSKIRPNVLVVGDSYYWGLIAGYDILNGFSKSSHFWYYYKKLEHKKVCRRELRHEIARQNVIIILATAHNLGDLGWGFIEDTYNMFKGITPVKTKPIEYEPVQTDPIAYANELNDTRRAILSDKHWLEDVEKGAKEKGISVDSAVTLNAIWIIEHKKK
ncbi:MAG TPA: hypothetical protein VN922_04570, partial [Bacteroidia bacterium]|nr:hypothetical protein [Bacteroidia bacterium]